MTLCMAAICYNHDKDRPQIVFGMDQRAEVSWAGGNVAFKFAWATKNWAALAAGELSKAQDFLATCHSVLGFEEVKPLTRDDMFRQVQRGVKRTQGETLPPVRAPTLRDRL